MSDLEPNGLTIVLILLFCIFIGFFLGVFFCGQMEIDSYKQDPEHWHRIYVEQKK